MSHGKRTLEQERCAPRQTVAARAAETHHHAPITLACVAAFLALRDVARMMRVCHVWGDALLEPSDPMLHYVYKDWS
jgi:hypothetical protein